MNCPSCDQANPDAARFCNACGAALASRCSECGAGNPSGSRFCNACGAALQGSGVGSRVPDPDTRHPTPDAVSETRKVVTIVFADLIGSTALHERLDPESVSRLMERYCQTELAARRAKAAGVTNVRFEPADATALPFPDDHFDAIHAHALIMHVSDPSVVFREMWRVLKSGGVIGVSDTIIDAWYATGPDEDLLTETFALLQKATRGYGGDWNRGKYLGPLLRAAGFERVEAGALYRHPAAEATPASGGMLIAGMIDNTRMGSLIVNAGLASREHLGRIVAAWRRLGDHPDGYFLAAEGEAVAWKP